MDTAQPQRTDRFTKLVIFASDHDFPTFAADSRINYKTVIGYYRGIIEESYVINIYNVNTILAGEILKGQDSVLLLAPQEPVYNGQRDTFRVKVSADGHQFDPNSEEYIGKWCAVSVAEALHSDAWICYPDDNNWYVVKMLNPDL